MEKLGPSQTTINENTKITLSLVGALIGAVLMFGVAWSRVKTLEERQDRFGAEFKDLRDKDDARWNEVHSYMLKMSADIGEIKGRLDSN